MQANPCHILFCFPLLKEQPLMLIYQRSLVMPIPVFLYLAGELQLFILFQNTILSRVENQSSHCSFLFFTHPCPLWFMLKLYSCSQMPCSKVISEPFASINSLCVAFFHTSSSRTTLPFQSVSAIPLPATKHPPVTL